VLNRVIVVPITSQTAKLYPGEAMLTLNGEQRKAMSGQIMTAANECLGSRRGDLWHSDVTSVENAISSSIGNSQIA